MHHLQFDLHHLCGNCRPHNYFSTKALADPFQAWADRAPSPRHRPKVYRDGHDCHNCEKHSVAYALNVKRCRVIFRTDGLPL